MDENAQHKMEILKTIIKELESVCIAFSGGVDSTFLTKVSRDVLGDNVLAVTATSPAYPEREIKEAIELAKEIGVEHILIESGEMNIPEFSENRPDRCYYCKDDLFRRLKDLADEYGLKHVIDGSNYDDGNDYRPGRKAASERGVRSPLYEAGLTKSEIRLVSRMIGLRTWNKPSFACLSSRIPYNERITAEKLRQVEEAEAVLRGLGLSQLRVRHHDHIARIEVLPEEFQMILNNRAIIIERLKALGFLYVTLDILGYRTGAMNEVLKG
ncbi:MAG: ATP-dependent sacrificial sulfur transferase LarE [Thermodesulfovibrionales bacterium]